MDLDWKLKDCGLERDSKAKRSIEKYMRARPDETVFLRSELLACLPPGSGVDSTLRGMLDRGKFVRVSHGVYVRAKVVTHPKTKRRVAVPTVPNTVWAAEAFRKLDVRLRPDSEGRVFHEDSNSPAFACDVGKSRISRQFAVGSRRLHYERFTN